MTKEELKNEIVRIKKIINSAPNKTAAIKFTSVELAGPFLRVTHTAGATGNTFEEIDLRLLKLGLPSLDSLKEMFNVQKEYGQPHTHYVLEVRMKALDRTKFKIAKAKKMAI